MLALQRAVRDSFAAASASGLFDASRCAVSSVCVSTHRLVDGVDEPDAQRLVGVHGPAGEDQVLRDPEATDAREPLRPAPARDDPEVHLRLAELRRRAA